MIAGRSTRMEVLELLRRKGRCQRGNDLRDLGVTPNAVRQHLTNLERDGFVISIPEKSRRGRPSLLFSLTERADSVFPSATASWRPWSSRRSRRWAGRKPWTRSSSGWPTRHAGAIATQPGGPGVRREAAPGRRLDRPGRHPRRADGDRRGRQGDHPQLPVPQHRPQVPAGLHHHPPPHLAAHWARPSRRPTPSTATTLTAHLSSRALPTLTSRQVARSTRWRRSASASRSSG